MRLLRTALRPLARGYATSVTGYGREVEGFVGAVGNTPLVSRTFRVVSRHRSLDFSLLAQQRARHYLHYFLSLGSMTAL